MKSKIVILLLVLSAGWFQLLPARAQVAGTSLNLGEFDKALSLFDKAVSLKINGQTIKAKREGLKALRLFDKLLKKDTLITATKECAFCRINHPLWANQILTRGFGLSCFFKTDDTNGNDVGKSRLNFRFVTSIDRNKSGFRKASWTTPNITETFEASELFTGTIKIVDVSHNTYSIDNNWSDYVVTVYCKILNLTPINQPPFVEKTSGIDNEDTPGIVLQKLESGQDVPRETIIKVLRSLINESK